jgi:nucleotide-binding universal stress UspA family protein
MVLVCCLGDDYLVYRKILLATDCSTNSLKAAEEAAQIAEKFDGTIHVLHVSPSIHFRLEPTTDAQRAIRDEETHQALNAMKRTKEVLDKHAARVVARDVEFGQPAEVICRVAEAEDFDLIVVGSRGASRVKSFLLGSVSAKVSADARCSVLIVR